MLKFTRLIKLGANFSESEKIKLAELFDKENINFKFVLLLLAYGKITTNKMYQSTELANICIKHLAQAENKNTVLINSLQQCTIMMNKPQLRLDDILYLIKNLMQQNFLNRENQKVCYYLISNKVKHYIKAYEKLTKMVILRCEPSMLSKFLLEIIDRV